MSGTGLNIAHVVYLALSNKHFYKFNYNSRLVLD